MSDDKTDTVSDMGASKVPRLGNLPAAASFNAAVFVQALEGYGFTFELYRDAYNRRDGLFIMGPECGNLDDCGDLPHWQAFRDAGTDGRAVLKAYLAEREARARSN